MAVRTRYGRSTAATVVLTITGIIVAVIALGILLVLLSANRGNMLVDFILDLGTWLTTPFHNLFANPNPKENVVLNWGLAAIVYAVIGGVIARLARG